jgi:putative ABC transport system substrate-binding protein
MRRRDFIKGIAGSAATWPLAARAQQPAMPVIGLLNPGSASAFANLIDAFRRGLAETGYVEGRNVAIEYRWAESRYDRLPALAADLVERRVTVIAALGSSAPGRAAKSATSTIPIVFQTGADPVAEGLVASMNRPAGNVTGVSRMTVATDPKRLELLHEAVPAATVAACFVNPNSPRADFQIKQIQGSAALLGLKLVVVRVGNENDLENAFATLLQAGATILLIANDPSLQAVQDQIATLAKRHAIPSISGTRTFVAAGGLMSYDASLADSFRQAGVYVGRVLHGEKPADLPVLQPTQFDLVINLKTAKALGIKVPQSLLVAADEVIE